MTFNKRSYVCVYIYICVCVCVCVNIYIYTLFTKENILLSCLCFYVNV